MFLYKTDRLPVKYLYSCYSYSYVHLESGEGYIVEVMAQNSRKRESLLKEEL